MIRRLYPGLAESQESVEGTWGPLAIRGEFMGLAYSGSLYVLVGYNSASNESTDHSLVVTSSDAENWVYQTPPTNDRLNAVTWVAPLSIFVAVGDSGVVFTSSDGISWDARVGNTPSNNNLLSVSWGETWQGTVVTAVGAGGTVITSPNGVDWTHRNITETGNVFNKVFWDGIQFVVLGPNEFLTSADGVSWSYQVTNITGTWQDGLYDGGKYVLAAGTFTGRIATSPTGAASSWTQQTTGVSYGHSGVAWSGTHFVVIPSTGTNNLIVSEDGISWSQDTLPLNGPNLNNIYWIDGKFLVLGRSQFYISVDGETWDIHTTGPTSTIRSIAYGGSRYVAVGEHGQASFSEDGETWIRSSSTTVANNRTLFDVVYGPGIFVAVGSAGTIIASTNGINWSSHSVATTRNFTSVAYSPSLQVYSAVANAGVIYTSVVNFGYELWEGKTSGTTAWLRDIIWANSQFVVVGNSGTVLTSVDGDSWVARTSNTSSILFSVAYSGSIIVAVGWGGAAITSVDGETWSSPFNIGTETLTSVIWTGEEFVAVGSSGTICKSFDGLNWDFEEQFTAAYLQCVAHHDGRYMIGTDSGKILSNQSFAPISL